MRFGLRKILVHSLSASSVPDSRDSKVNSRDVVCALCSGGKY